MGLGEVGRHHFLGKCGPGVRCKTSSSRCLAYPFSRAGKGEMAAAADFGPGSWLWPAFAGAPPAPRIPHTEGRCLCGMQGAGSVRGTTGIWQLPRAKRARWAPSHTHTTLQVIRGRPSMCEESSSTRRTRRCPRSPSRMRVESGRAWRSSRDHAPDAGK